MRLVHSQSIIKHAIYIDYMSILETLEDFWMTLSLCSKHQVGAWAILYPLVKVVVHSDSIIKYALKINYTSTLETFESFWMPSSRCSEHRVGAWVILYPLVNVSSPGNYSW